MLANKCIKPKSAPMEFKRIQIRLNDSRPLKAAASHRDRYKIIWGLAARFGIKKHTAEVSYIGHSVVEFYVVKEAHELCANLISSCDIEIVDVDPVKSRDGSVTEQSKKAAIHRLGLLYRRMRTLKLKEAVLEGIQDEKIKQAIKEKANPSLAAEPVILVPNSQVPNENNQAASGPSGSDIIIPETQVERDTEMSEANRNEGGAV